MSITTISKYFFKKNSKDIVSFSIILLIATILFASAITLNNNISDSYDDEFSRLNTANAFFTIPNIEYEDSLIEDIKNIDGIKDVEKENGIMLNIPVNMDGSIQEQTQIFYNINNISNINKREIENKTSNDIDFGIYLSNYTFIHSGLNILDKYEFKVNDINYSFNIKGSINEMQYGNYTSSSIGEYLESDSYNYLLENNKDKEIITISVKSDDGHSAYNNVSKYLSSKNINVLTKNYAEQIKNQRLAISNILVIILVVFSSLMLIISLFVSKFKIENTIEEEMANMGVLKSLGYTSNEIIVANIIPYIISGVLFTLIGILVSYSILPLLSSVIEMQSGFKWKILIDIMSNILVLLINVVLIIVFTLMASFRIKKLNPINAIRGLTEKEKRKNHFEIEKTKGNIHFILILKNFINAKKQNILLGIVLFFVTIVLSFIGILFYNINLNPINFINTLVEEHPSVVITSESDLRQDIKEQNNVKKVIYYDENASLNYKNNSYKTLVSESFDNLANDLCYEGSNPRENDEVAIGSKIRETYNLNIGDYIKLSKNGKEFEKKIVGFIQSVNYSGEIIEVTLSAYQELDTSYKPKIMYVYLNDESKSEEFIDEIQSKYNDNIISTMNYVESMDSAMEMYVSLISIICTLIMLIALLLIYLILYIIISSIITRRKQELGIFKAIGYENKQLVRQLVGGFIPSAVMGVTLGFLLSRILMSNIYLGIFNTVGAYKVSFDYPIIIFLIVAILLILSVWIIGTIISKKIKKISVYSLIKD
ncbi:MAG: ABC transporter permease [Clostridium sp.]|nr:ABC transporter permease [Clostridium sp.]MCM1444455.1 ABC transporter permease [Candidatus Amulumruptor caecigallinarius]